MVMDHGALLSASASGAIVVVVYLAVIVIEIAALWKIFEKAGAPGWAAIIPIYNAYVLLEDRRAPGVVALAVLHPADQLDLRDHRGERPVEELRPRHGIHGRPRAASIRSSFPCSASAAPGTSVLPPPPGYSGGPSMGYGSEPSAAPGRGSLGWTRRLQAVTAYALGGSSNGGLRPAGAPAWDRGAAAPGGIPADWYADPTGGHQLRYWNGGAWTEHVSDNGVQAVDPV